MPIDMNDPEVQEAIAKATDERLKNAVQEAVNKETAGLVAKRDELLAEKKKVKSELDEIKTKYPLDDFEQLLKEREEAKLAAMSVEERMEAKERDIQERFAKREKEMTNKWEEERKSYLQEKESMESSLRRHLIDAQLNAAIAKAEGIPELLAPAMRDKISVIQENGEYVARVMENGNPRVADTSGAPMAIEHLVDEFKNNELYQPAFRPSGATGGGTSSNNKPSAGGVKAKPRSEMTFQEKMEYANKYGDEAYLALPA